MSEQNNKFPKIYGIVDPMTDKVVYIGKANNVQKRLKTHILDSKRRKTRLYQWMQDRIENNQQIKIIELASSISDDWQSLEKQMIFQYGGEGALLNMAKGGNQPIGCPEANKLNAIKLNNKRAEDAFEKKIWEMKRAMGHYLKILKAREQNSDNHKSIVAKLKYAADKRPDLFGCWSAL